MEMIHIYNLTVLFIALLIDALFIKINSSKKIFTKGETTFWCVAIIIWTFWIYYMIRGLFQLKLA